jgi:hypothetical protein
MNMRFSPKPFFPKLCLAKPANFRRGRAFLLINAIMVSALLTVLPNVLQAAPEIGLSDDLVADPRSGAALFGFDPVSYFIDGKAVMGANDISLVWRGHKWRFAKRENREIFERAPEAYLPKIGGLDPLRLADGFMAAADPRIFLINDKGLWLFRNERSRAQFLADPSARMRAEKNWNGELFPHAASPGAP